MRSRPLLASLAVVAGLASGAAVPAAASATCPGETVNSSVQTESAMAQSILCLVNERRAAAGVGPVFPNGKLEQAALAHSSDMVSNGFFGHNSPDGIDFVQRIEKTGYTNGARAWLAGENLAWGSGSLSTPAELVQGWMVSPPHRANLLRGQFREIGIGVVRGTPEASSAIDGVTVSTEYGYRSVQKAKKAKPAKSAKRGPSRGTQALGAPLTADPHPQVSCQEN